MDEETMNNVYVKIQNNGEIDINALRLMGATSKRGDNTKIGYFGSGLKYAIAVLMRNEIDFRIFSGEKEIKVSISKKKFRGQEFNVIKFNNQLTSLTTEMGVDWENWFPIREIYCNAIDEGGCKIDVIDSCVGIKGKTIFYIQFSEKIKEVFNNWNNYFSDKRDDVISKIDKDKFFFGGEHIIVYRKGVNVFEKDEKCLFNYDLNDLKIGEDRVVKSVWDMNWDIVDKLKKYANEKMIKMIYDNWKNTYEGRFEWDNGGDMFNDVWLDALGGRRIILEDIAGNFVEEMSGSTIILPNSLALSLKKWFKDKIKIVGFSDRYGQKKILKFNNKQKNVLDYCVKFLEGECNISNYEIKLCDFDDQYTLGEAIDNTILLSPRTFDYGKKKVVSTLIEEYSHLDSMAGDKTRRFQDYLINKFISIIEDRKKINL